MLPRERPVPERSPRERTRPSQGRLYKVFIHNDDVTPMAFVVHVLATVFLVPPPNAEYIMYAAHLTGSAYVQTLPASEARSRINKARFAGAFAGFPLQFSMEPE